jgi:hypothetical protein
VTKTGLILTSFVAAIPGAALAYLMVMAFLSHSGGPSMWSKALAGMLLVIGGLLAVMPFGIIVFAGPKTEKAPKKPEGEAAKEEGSAVVAAESESESELEAEEAEEGSGSRAVVTDPSLEVVEANSDDFAMTGKVEGAAEDAAELSEDDSDFEVNAAAGESDDEFFEAEEDEPKKGKKK